MANMKRIEFYKTINGASPVEEFLETLDDNQEQKGSSLLLAVFKLYTYFLCKRGQSPINVGRSEHRLVRSKEFGVGSID